MQRAIFEDRAMWCGRSAQNRQHRAGDRIERDTCATAIGNLHNPRRQILFFRRDNVVGADILECRLLAGMTRGGNYAGAALFGNLNSCNSDAAARRRDERHITRSKISIVDQRAVGGQILHPNGRALDWRETSRIWYRHFGRHHRALAIYTVARL